MKKLSRRNLFFLFIVPVCLFIITSNNYARFDDPIPEVGIKERQGNIVPLDLVFKDSNGKQVKLRDLITNTTVISLVYFDCPTVCKPLLGAEVDVLDKISLKPGKDYNVITVSFNEDDNPAAAKDIKDNFMKRFNKKFPPDAWHFLTGDKESIRKLTDSLGFYFKRTGDDFAHPTGLIMLSPEGKITRYFYGIRFLPFDVKLGMLEASKGKIGATISKVLLYCFSYDPEGKTYVFNILKVTGTITVFFGLIFITWLFLSTRKRRKKE